MTNVAVFVGFGNEEDEGNKNHTFKRIYAKPQNMALNLDSQEEILQSTLFANRFLRKNDGGDGQLFNNDGNTNNPNMCLGALLFTMFLHSLFS